MNIEQLLACADVLGEMTSNFTALPNENNKGLEAGVCCQLARSYVVELAKHISDGMEPYDAMVATANGELEIPEAKALLFKVLTAKPSK